MSVRADLEHDQLRDAVRVAWERGESLHSLGREIGLSPAGLLKFLNGSVPRPPTLAKLSIWYLSSPQRRDEPSPEQVRAIFHRLLPDLPNDIRSSLLNSFAGIVSTTYRSRGSTPPRWAVEPATG
jgi:hypothetical protein